MTGGGFRELNLERHDASAIPLGGAKSKPLQVTVPRAGEQSSLDRTCGHVYTIPLTARFA
jgi:hypothetical protein